MHQGELCGLLGAHIILLMSGTTVVSQGNETRMGKGKGTFEFWACRYAPFRHYLTHSLRMLTT